MLKKLSYWLSIAIVGVAVGLTLQFAMAWTEPGVAPPNGNVGAPITTSGVLQNKSGSLGIGGAFLDVKNNLYVENGAVGIGTKTLGALLDVAGTGGTAIQIENGGDLVISSADGTSSPTTLYNDTGSLNIDTPVNAPAFYYSSDINLKKDVTGLTNALDSVTKLRGVSFLWKDDSRNVDGKQSLGLIAQEVEKVYPELVKTDLATGLKSVQYGNLVAPLIEAIKEQQTEINSLNDRLTKLEEKN